MQQLDPSTHVVSCFLVRETEGGSELLLVRRSPRMRTYAGRWAAISGYVEPGDASATDRAWAEIREETGLVPPAVSLSVAEELFTVDDGTHRWVVHPFRFTVGQDATIRTDWEADGWQWILPEAMTQYPTVPGLDTAWERVATMAAY